MPISFFSLPPHNGPLWGYRGRIITRSGGPVGWKKCGAPQGCPPYFFHRHPLLLCLYASPCSLGGPLWGGLCGKSWASGSLSLGLCVSGWVAWSVRPRAAPGGPSEGLCGKSWASGSLSQNFCVQAGEAWFLSPCCAGIPDSGYYHISIRLYR
jgi:hypothetical protein